MKLIAEDIVNGSSLQVFKKKLDKYLKFESENDWIDKALPDVENLLKIVGGLGKCEGEVCHVCWPCP